MSSHSHRQSLDTWAKGHNQPPFISPLATCCAFDLFLCCNLILSIALESSVFTLCSSHLELTKVRRAPSLPVSPLSALRNRVRSSSADKGKPGQTPVAQGGDARPCTSTCTDSLAWVCFWRWAWRFVKISYCWVMSILTSRSWNPKSRNSPMYHSVRICRLECGGSTQGSGLRHPPNVRVFSSRPEKDVRPKEAKLTMIIEFYK